VITRCQNIADYDLGIACCDDVSTRTHVRVCVHVLLAVSMGWLGH